jgi:Preprotein translocase subunit SecD
VSTLFSGRVEHLPAPTLPGRESKTILAENINLGLDLRGGSHLVMRVKTDDYLKTLTENNAQAALTAAQDAKTSRDRR